MATQVTVSGTLSITQGNLSYQSRPNAYQVQMAGTNGPTPGSVLVSINGTDISFSELDSMGGLCFCQNYDQTNYVTVGLRDTITNEFYPLFELLPGEFTIFRLSRKLPKHETGTGTFTGSNVTLHAKADTANLVMRVDGFDA